jgi:hypothetical protein
MIKKIGTFFSAFALAAFAATPAFTPLAASAADCSGSVSSGACAHTNFDLSATVSTIATVTFSTSGGGSTFTWGSSDFSQFNGASVHADNNPGTINATFRESASSGAASIYFTAPSSIPGTQSGNAITLSSGVLTFTCTGTYQPNTTTGPGTAVTAPGGTTSAGAVSGSGNNACASFTTAGLSVAGTNIGLNLFLNGDTLAADNYSTTNSGGTPFTVYVSAT